LSYEATLKDKRTGNIIKSCTYNDPVEAADRLQKSIHIKFFGYSVEIKPIEILVEPIHIDIEPIDIIIEELRLDIGGES
jgi:hypothetical protein